MSNVMSLLKLRNKPQRNGFDLSRKNAFTAKVGELLPVMHLHLLPTSKINIDLNTFTRTQPLQTAAFTRIKEYYDFFFVPYRLMFSNAPAAFAGTNERQRALTVNQSSLTKIGSGLPSYSPFSVYSLLKGYAESEAGGAKDELGYNGYEKTLKLLHYLDAGVPLNLAGNYYVSIPNLQLTAFTPAAYQKIYMDYFRDSQWQKNNPLAYNFDYLGNMQADDYIEVPYSSLIDNTVVRDDLFTLRYCNYPADYFMGLLPNSQYGDVATVATGESSTSSSISTAATLAGVQFLDHLGVGTVKEQSPMYWDGVNAAWNGVDTSAVTAGNMYFKVNDESSGHNGKNDRIMAVQGTLQADLADVLSSNGSFSILALRRAEALQKYREITQTQDKDYKGQMDAHFGANVSNVLSDKCMWLGGMQSTIQIGDVTNTNLDQSSDSEGATKRAWIYGKGTNTVDGHINFTAPEHGVLMCIYHAVPLLDYDGVVVDPMEVKTDVNDYAVPEFDQIGMQETLLGFLSPWTPAMSSTLNFDPWAKTIGYAPRYAEYKTAIDKVHGAFTTTLKDWYSPLTPEYLVSVLFKKNVINSGGIEEPTVYYTYDASSWYLLKKVNPNIVDTIFGVNADSGVDTDCLLVNSFFNIKAVLPLDRNGLPY